MKLILCILALTVLSSGSAWAQEGTEVTATVPEEEVTILVGDAFLLFQTGGTVIGEQLSSSTVTTYNFIFKNVSEKRQVIDLERMSLTWQAEDFFANVNVTLERFIEGSTVSGSLSEPFDIVLAPGEVVELRFTVPIEKAGVWALKSSGAVSTLIVN